MSLTTDDSLHRNMNRPPAVRKRTPEFLAGFVDLWNGLKRHELWLNLSWEDLLQSYYRTKLGLIWGPLSFATRIGVYVLIFWRLVDGGNFEAVICYIALGFIVWETLSSGLTGGLTLFSVNANWIKSSSMPFSVFAFQSTTTLLFRFLLNLLCIGGILIAFRKGLPADLQWYDFIFSLIAIFAMIINMIWVQVFFAIICARFRDIQHFIGAIIRIVFFLTPVIWRPNRLGEYAEIIHALNPFSYFIAIFRDPILYSTVPVNSWVVVGIITVIGHITTWILLGLTKKKVVFWL